MRAIEIDDETYGFLLGQARASGGTLLNVLRRLLGLEKPDRATATNTSGTTNPKGQAVPAVTNGNGTVAAFLNSPTYLVRGSAVEKFLSILSWLYSENREKFEKVLLLSGRKRRYFAKTSDELDASGNSVMPKPVPNSPFWVITNSPTQLKKQIVEDVMRILGYDASNRRMVVDTVH